MDEQLIKNIAQTITEADGGKLRVGHIGLPGFMESLVENGLGQVVYDAVNHTEFPGWGYMVDQGATPFWPIPGPSCRTLPTFIYHYVTKP